MNLNVDLAGISLKNPVMTASGTFGSGEEFSEFVDLNRLGAVVTKGVALVPWEGNPTPRIAETCGGMLNAVGLQNPGIDLFIKRDIPFLKKFDTKIIVNVCGRSVYDYLDVADITEMARAAEAGGADILSLINTLTGMKIDIHKQTFVLANKTGGLSGPAIHPVAVRMVYETARAVKLPIVGMGGIQTSEDAIEMMLAGATAVAVGTANFHNPFVSEEIIDGIEKYLKEQNILDVKELIGAVNEYN